MATKITTKTPTDAPLAWGTFNPQGASWPTPKASEPPHLDPTPEEIQKRLEQIMSGAPNARPDQLAGDYERVGWDFLNQLLLQEALAAFSKALDIDPDAEGAMTGLAATAYWVPLEVHSFNYVATEAYQKMVEAQPQNREFQKLLADNLLGRREFRRALHIYEDLIKGEPENPFYLAQKAECLIKLNHSKESLKILGRVLSAHPDFRPAIEKMRMINPQFRTEDEPQKSTRTIDTWSDDDEDDEDDTLPA